METSMLKLAFGLVTMAGIVLAQVHTPDSIQTAGFVADCARFATATEAGDNCLSMAQRNGIDVDYFVQINPQLNGLAGCSSSVWLGYAYCVRTAHASTPTMSSLSATPDGRAPAVVNYAGQQHPSAPQSLDLVVVTQWVGLTVSPLAPLPSPSPPPSTFSTQTTTAPPPPRITPAPSVSVSACPIGDCYRAFLWGSTGGVVAYQSSWCASVLSTSLPDQDWSDLTGAPALVSQMCQPTDVTRNCRCLLNGQVTYAVKPNNVDGHQGF